MDRVYDTAAADTEHKADLRCAFILIMHVSVLMSE